MRTALALAFVLGGTSAHAHCYSIWRYPTPQHCRAMAMAPRIRLPHRALEIRFPPEKDIEIPLPALEFIAVDEPDEDTRGRLMLRACLMTHEANLGESTCMIK